MCIATEPAVEHRYGKRPRLAHLHPPPRAADGGRTASIRAQKEVIRHAN